MMKKLLLMLLALLLATPALAETLPPFQPALEMETVAEHASDTLVWRIGKTKVDKATV